MGGVPESVEPRRRRAGGGGAPPTTTTLQDDDFHSQGLDLRFVHRWGRGNALTFGTVLFHDWAPFRQWISSNLIAGRNVSSGTPRLDQDRDSWYGAIFAETVFRLPHRFHLVPSFRIDRERIRISESVRPPNLVRPLIDTSVVRTIPLFSLGAGFDFGHQNETYFNVSQGYRPLRFFDVASPFANVGATAIADPAKSVSWEAGVHGTPVKGLFYDASLFWIDFRNRIETIVLSATDSVNQNSGDTRHRGFEGELSYDFLASRPGDTHLTAFVNLSLLHARFTASRLTNRVGNIPAFAPGLILKAGLTLRRDDCFNVNFSGSTVSAQYWQDSNLPVGTGASFIPAKVPHYTVLDLSSDYALTRRVHILAGVSNLGDAHYYNRVFQNGIEPAQERKFYGGIALEL